MSKKENIFTQFAGLLRSKTAGILSAAVFVAAGVLYCAGIDFDDEKLIYQSAITPAVSNREADKEAVTGSEMPKTAETASEMTSLPVIDSENAEQAVTNSETDIPVDINKASAKTLMSLNGIGKTRAEAIIEYRNTHGAFKCIEDIMLVPGIKEGIYNKIKDCITVTQIED